MPLDYAVWVIQEGARAVVVDTGFDAAAAATRGRTDIFCPVAEGLAAIGVDPATVLDVVITHMHYDHAGNVGLFPRARFHVQDAEMAYCTGRAMTHPHLAAPFDGDNVVAVVRRIFDSWTRRLSRRRLGPVCRRDATPSSGAYRGIAGGAGANRTGPGGTGL